ncbi:MAG: hypothetical protein Q3988_07340 [Gemella sp.]|nr:hypothetical protein [Gemella sp.]
MSDLKIVEQISSFKKIPVGDNAWRLAFYHIANSFWDLEEHYIVVDRESFEVGLNLPLMREYKETVAMQFFTSYVKAQDFVEAHGDDFVVDGKKLIYRLRQGAFRQVFAPFLAQQNFNYIINDPEEHFLDTFERLLGVMEADTEYVVDEDQKKMLEEGDYKSFFVDICEKYLVHVG